MTESDSLVDAKIAASEARTDTKFAELGGEVRLMNADLSAKIAAVLTAVQATDENVSRQRSETKADFRASRALTVALFAIMLGAVTIIVSFGSTMFSRGLPVRDVVRAIVHEQQGPAPSKTP